MKQVNDLTQKTCIPVFSGCAGMMLWCVTVLALFSTVHAGLTVVYEDSTVDTVSVATIHETGYGECAALDGVCEALGLSSVRTAQTDTRIYTGPRGRRYRFAAGVRFCTAGASVYQLVYAPIERKGELYYPVDACARLVTSVFARVTAEYSPEDIRLYVRSVQLLQTEDSDAVIYDNTAVQTTIPAINSIVIDPGHGGRDPGAIGPGGIMEKDVVLDISLHLASLIRENTGMSVYMTRDTDEFIPLRTRTDFANEKKADLFISIHANAIGGSKKRREHVRGYKMYFLSEAKNETDKRVAMRENAVVEFEEKTDRGDYLQNILLDITSNEYLEESQRAAICLAGSFDKELDEIDKLHRGVGQANFWVLNGALMPAVLVETAFISNPREEKMLADKTFRKKLAESIFTAITEFKRRYEE